jgi:hypothetical protein
MGDNGNHRILEARVLFDKNSIASKVLENVGMIDLAVPMPSQGDITRAVAQEDSVSLTESTIDFFDEILLLCERRLLKPVLIYAGFPIASVEPDQGVLLGDGSQLSCSARLFVGASHVVAAIGSIGSGLENQVSSAFESGDPFHAVILDAIGSIMLRRMVEEFYAASIIEAAKANMGMGPRVSPGCHRTPLSNQKTLFSLLDASSIGVRLSSSYLMSPMKSSSLFFPLGENIPVRLRTSDWCKFCDFSERCHSRYI